VIPPEADAVPSPTGRGGATTTAERLHGLEQWHFWFVGRDRLVANLLGRFPPPDPIVDVGCGTGRFAATLRFTGRMVVALDRELGSLPPGGAVGVRGDAERLPFADASVGTILARDVLEHLDDVAALADWRRVLRRDGLLVVLVPAWPSLWSHRDVAAGHIRRYTRGTLRSSLEAAGFDLLELRGYQCALLPVIALSRVAGRRRRGEQLQAEEHPPPLVNAVFGALNRLEAACARSRLLRVPTGSTLAAVARRR
jgi:SAM-dependent methyltransferase